MRMISYVAAIVVSGATYSCATEADDALRASPRHEAATAPASRWEASYRTGSRLPLRESKVTATTQPVYQFDAVEWERQRPPAGTHGQ